MSTTAGTVEYPFDSFEELADSKYLVAALDGSGTQFQFSQAPEGTVMRCCVLRRAGLPMLQKMRNFNTSLVEIAMLIV